MSPDSPTPSSRRRAWRLMATLGCVLGGGSLLANAVTWKGTANDVQGADERARKAVCAVVSYAERQADVLANGQPASDGRPARPGNPQAATELRQLARDMRKTGIHCPPKK